MTADTRDAALAISHLLFRLTTEGIRMYSNRTRSYEDLSSLAVYLASAANIAAHDTDVLLQHLDVIPTRGDIQVYLKLPPPCAARLEALRTGFETRVARPITIGDTLSLLLFDFTVGQRADAVLANLGLSGSAEF